MERIRCHALLAGDKEELARFEIDYVRSQNATIFVVGDVWPGVQIEFNGDFIKIKEKKRALEFKRENGAIKMYPKALTLA